MQQLSDLVHVRAGSGETVVLIHGIGHRKEAWQPVFDRLSERYDVIAVDLAGFGRSAPYPPGVPYTMANACADLAANFASWGVVRPHVVGNSLGGAISLELAARELVCSATVLSPAGFFGRFDRFRALVPLLVMWLASHLPAAVLRAVSRSAAGRRLVGAMLYAHPERTTAGSTYGDAVAMRDGRGFLPTLRAGVGYDFSGDVTVPTTVAWGSRDRLLPPVQARTARRRLPRARHVPLAGAGHVPMVDVPEQIVAIVEETIARGVQARAA